MIDGYQLWNRIAWESHIILVWVTLKKERGPGTSLSATLVISTYDWISFQKQYWLISVSMYEMSANFHFFCKFSDILFLKLHWSHGLNSLTFVVKSDLSFLVKSFTIISKMYLKLITSDTLAESCISKLERNWTTKLIIMIMGF